jgi:putative component of toxin-antitoxin plasmid stabilization module
MDLWFINEGALFTVYSIDEKSRDESLRHFLKGLKQDDSAEWKRLNRRLVTLSENGRNSDRDVGRGLYELKTSTGARLLYFFDKSTRSVIVLTGGFKKGAKKVQSGDIARGRRRKIEYENALKADKLELVLTDKRVPTRIPGE